MKPPPELDRITDAVLAYRPDAEIAESIPEALYVGTMQISDLAIPCAVLDDGRRVITETGIATMLNSRSGASKRIKKGERDQGRAPLPIFLAPKRLEPYVIKHLSDGPLLPIQYRHKTQVVDSYDCRLLPKICRVWIEAAIDGKLLAQQIPKTQKALSFLSGLGELGIIGLVDEATGYQEVRDRLALHRFLDKYLKAERAKWAKRFPDEFYKQIFRLRDWQWKGMKVNRPSVVGHYTNDIVWDRIAPYIHDELRNLNPKTDTGHRKAKHHQWLTEDIGHPALRDHLSGVVAIMRVSSSWRVFKKNIQIAFPKKSHTIPLNLDEPNEDML